jgi:hypothetical protein
MLVLFSLALALVFLRLLLLLLCSVPVLYLMSARVQLRDSRYVGDKKAKSWKSEGWNECGWCKCEEVKR